MLPLRADQWEAMNSSALVAATAPSAQAVMTCLSGVLRMSPAA
jgi:hypothetical protein